MASVLGHFVRVELESGSTAHHDLRVIAAWLGEGETTIPRERDLGAPRFHGAIGIVLGLAVAFGAGCSAISGQVPLASEPVATGSFRAGAARVELTPPLGYPMGGHSVAGEVARGYWTRLHARALYFEDAAGVGFVLVATDLWSMPSGLNDRVAELLASDRYREKLGERRLARGQVVLAASHTHQSPALFSSDRFFSTFAAEKPGFDPKLHEFLAHRIAWVAAEAVGNAEPARLAVQRTRVDGVFRNRSMRPFLENEESERVMEESGAGDCTNPHPLYPDARCCRAVDTRLRVLRVEHAAGPRAGEPIALAVFLAAHPEAMSAKLAVYSSDVFGSVATGLERRGAAPVVALFNGAEGDVSVTFEGQDRRDLLRVSRTIVDHVLAMPAAASVLPAGDVTHAFEPDARLAARRFRDRDGRVRYTAALAMTGRATAAGAEDGPSGMPAWLWSEGVRSIVGFGPQGRKLGTLDPIGMLLRVRLPLLSLTRAALVALTPPREVALGVYGVGPLRFVTLPGEATTVAGRRVAEQVARESQTRVDDVFLLGLAQAYAQYFTTPEEYDLQHYEGASMLYGRQAASLLASELAALAHDGTRVPRDPRTFSYRPWLRQTEDRRRRAAEIERRPEVLGADVTDVIVGAPGDRTPVARPRACWTSAAVDFPDDEGAGDSEPVTVTPKVRIERQVGGVWRTLEVEPGIPEDDGGVRFLTLGRERDGRMHWCVYWLPPAGLDESSPLRFVIEQRGEGMRYVEFDLEDAGAVSE